MKNLIVTTLIIFTFITATSQTKNFIDQPYIEVNGNADTLIVPDEIYVRIVISENDTKNRISVEEQEIKMVNVLKTLGIDTEKDLTTNDISSNFRYYFLKNKDVLKTKQYLLKVNDAVTATKVFINLEDIGISNSSIERVDYSDKENIKNLVRSKAIANAKAEAIATVKPLNQAIGNAINITDNVTFTYNNNTAQSRLDEVVVTGYSIKGKSNGIDLPNIEFDNIRISASINVKFVLK